MSTLPETLKSLRTAAKLTQKQLAAATGISQQMISGYESGANEPPVSVALTLVKALGAGVEVLDGGRAAKPIPKEAVNMPGSTPEHEKRESIRRHILRDLDARRGDDDKLASNQDIADLVMADGFGTCSRGLVSQVRHQMMKTFEHPRIEGAKPIISARGGYSQNEAGEIVRDLKPFFVPLVGMIAAGQPMDEPAEVDERLEVSKLYPRDTVAFLVRGTSMTDALIADGDYVLVRPNDDPPNGSVVMAWIKDAGATLKKYDSRKKELKGQNAAERWVHKLRPEDRIMGVYVGIVRKA